MAEKRDQIWDKCVADAKAALKMYDDVRISIASFAIKACDISQGGRSTYGQYTLKKFAKQIGIAYGTLHEWVRVKRLVIDKLPPESRKEPFTVYKDFVAKVGEDASSNDVTLLYNKRMSRNSSSVKMGKYLKHLITILYNAKRPDLLYGCDPQILLEISNAASEIEALLSRYLRSPRSKQWHLKTKSKNSSNLSPRKNKKPRSWRTSTPTSKNGLARS